MVQILEEPGPGCPPQYNSNHIIWHINPHLLWHLHFGCVHVLLPASEGGRVRILGFKGNLDWTEGEWGSVLFASISPGKQIAFGMEESDGRQMSSEANFMAIWRRFDTSDTFGFGTWCSVLCDVRVFWKGRENICSICHRILDGWIVSIAGKVLVGWTCSMESWNPNGYFRLPINSHNINSHVASINKLILHLEKKNPLLKYNRTTMINSHHTKTSILNWRASKYRMHPNKLCAKWTQITRLTDSITDHKSWIETVLLLPHCKHQSILSRNRPPRHTDRRAFA